jgi:2-hydroxyethylphosphonate dioxygenase
MVASMSSAPHLPDLSGLFMRVEKDEDPTPVLDLVEPGETHYLVTGGQPTFAWHEGDKRFGRQTLTPGGSAWVAPYVEHAWLGDGALVKLGSGRHVGALDQLELTNTFEAEKTIRRGRGDAIGWGYDSDGGG